jgi:CubicO group peptidase (beta-lactamase class C family)
MAGLTARVMAVSIRKTKFTRDTPEGLKAGSEEDRLGAPEPAREIRMSILRKVVSGIATCGLVLGTLSAVGARGPQDKTTAAVDEVFADYTKNGSPGCAVSVYRNGQASYSRGYGLANIEENVPITPQTVFDIGSTSKQFTAASILLLEKQGKLSVHDDIRKFIPELPDYGQKITILNLLNHTSGLRDYLTLMDLAGINTDSVTTDEDALQIIARQKAVNFAPGSDWLYSNTGFFLLSIIVKRVSGKTLREFAAENIFTPLGMTHTQFRDDHSALIPNRAMAYDAKENKDGYTLDVSYFEQTGDGAVHTSVEDLLKWDENFYSGQVGGKDFLAEIQEQGKLNSGKVLDYAKGLFVADYRGLHTVSHGGAWGGYRAELLRFPDQHFSVACLCNRGDANPSRRAHQVADIYLGSLMKPKEEKKAAERETAVKKEIPLTTEQVRVYAGDYWSNELGVTYRLGIVDGKLKVMGMLDGGGFLHTSTLPANAFDATAVDEFTLSKTPVKIHFERDSSQAISGFMLDAGRTRGMVFARRGSAAN